jgi:hypothetical protein
LVTHGSVEDHMALVLVSAVLMLISAPAATAAPPTPSEGSVIVTGRRNTDEEVRDFVRALTPEPVGGLRRMEDSVCPVAVGLNPTQAALVTTRIRKVATATGLTVGGEHCTPNVILAVTDNKPLFLQQLLRTKSDYFGQIPEAKIRAILRSREAAVAWQTDGVPLNARGQRLTEDSSLGVYINRSTEAGSRLQNPVRNQFETAVVVVERQALGGLTTTQLADYAAMRALTAADPDRLQTSNAPTILKVIDAPATAQVPLSLTNWDVAFLKGYYTTHRSWSTAAQQSEMRKDVLQGITASAGR